MPQKNRSRSRRIGSTALGVLAAVALMLSLVTAYAQRVLFDSDQFANHASAALARPEVRDEVGRRIADGVVEAQPDLLSATPLIQSAAAAVVGTRQFSDLFRLGVQDLHRAIFNRDENTVVLTVPDVGAILNGVVHNLAPRSSVRIKGADKVPILNGHVPSFFGTLARIADTTRLATLVLVLFALVAGGLGLWLAPDRRRYVSLFAAAAVIVAATLILAYQIGRSVVLGKVADPDARSAAGAIWDTFLWDLRTILLIAAGAAVILLAAINFAFRPIGVEDHVARGWRWATTVPERAWARVVRALVLVALGVFIVLDSQAAIDLAVLVAGLYLVYKGVEELLRLIAPAPAPDRSPARRSSRRWRRFALAGAVVLVVGAVGVGLVVAFNGSDEAAASLDTGCNGSAKLCDKPLADVALPATHNSMAGADVPGFRFPSQEHGIRRQLDDGVRGFLIDAYYGLPANGGNVKTDLADATNVHRKQYVNAIGEPAVDAALRIRDRLVTGGSRANRAIYLCHRFCELGAVPLDRALDQFRSFVVQHPGQVLVLVVQDHVTARDFAAAVEDSGLSDFAYRGPITSTTPTLGEMVSSDHRVVLMAEEHGGGAPWYRSGYADVLTETPYRFNDPSLLTDPSKLARSCRAHRGSSDNPLFLLNHWIDTSPAPRPSNAKRVNAYRALLRRARRCGRIRRQAPNLIAVDFYGLGGLMRVVDKLNGVSPPTGRGSSGSGG